MGQLVQIYSHLKLMCPRADW